MHNVANILKEEEKNPYSPSVSDTVFKVGPKFEMIATVTLRLDECSKGMNCYNKMSLVVEFLTCHSMAKGNLNKTEKTKTETTTA